MNFFYESPYKVKKIISPSDYKDSLDFLENDLLEPYLNDITENHDAKQINLLRHEDNYFIQYEYICLIFFDESKQYILIDPSTNYIPIITLYNDMNIDDTINMFLSEYIKLLSDDKFFLKRSSDGEIDYISTKKPNERLGANHYLVSNYYFVYFEKSIGKVQLVFPNLIKKSVKDLNEQLKSIITFSYDKCQNPESLPKDELEVLFKFNEEKVLYSCFIYKQSYWIKEWRLRYLIVTEKTIYTFKNNVNLTSPTLEIPLKDCFQVVKCFDKQRNIIKLCNIKGEFKFQTRSQEEADNLMRMFAFDSKNKFVKTVKKSV